MTDNLYLVVDASRTRAVSGRWLTRRSDDVWLPRRADSVHGPAGLAIMDQRTAENVAALVGGTVVPVPEADQ